MTTDKKKTVSVKKKRRFYSVFYNTKPTILLLLIPLGVGLFTVSLIGSGLYYNTLADIGSQRLVTPNWESARSSLEKAQPSYLRKFAYYKVKEGQTLENVAAYFSVDSRRLVDLNPGQIVPGTTIKISPPEHPLKVTSGPNGTINQAVVVDDRGVLRVTQKYSNRQPIVTTIPELKEFLAPHGAIEQTGPRAFRLAKSISLDGDIRLDITPATITKLEIHSSPGRSICLCMDESAVLIDGVEVTTYDPATQKPDETYEDGRGFIRMKNGRMDILNSRLHHLGTSLDFQQKSTTPDAAVSEGGMYGVSWRISKGTLGQQITTGWVENNTFDNNHFGAYTFGASGMLWRGNLFADNDIYGLDPHDDSNNALVENNVFYRNGKHGFIVSKRCNYNIIRGNLSISNMSHGYMLHQDSEYNLIESNIAYGNVDNFVIYDSNFNTIRSNVGYSPRSSHVRINQAASNVFITHNRFEGGRRGIYAYGGAVNILIEHNIIHQTEKTLATNGAANVLFADNTIDQITYDIAPGDRMIYGTNTVDPQAVRIPDMVSILNSNAVYTARSESLNN